MSAPLDAPAAVRPGEELDTAALGAWLADAVPELAGAITVEQFPSGYSNLTYLLRVGERQVVLRRPPVGSKVATAHDMEREHRILTALHPALGTVPRPLAFCADPEILGAPFYLMERVRGVILRARLPRGVEIDRTTARRLSTTLAGELARLHRVDVGAAGLSDLGRPQGYAERQVTGWARRYAAARTDDVPELAELAAWLAREVPEPIAACLVHNDFKYDNLVLAGDDLTRVIAILDWEMATIGDPLMDLGTTLGYWIEAGDSEALQRFRFGPTHLPGSLDRRGVADAWGEASGFVPRRLDFYYAFGLFKIAGIAQQIYARYRQGLTADPRFAALGAAVEALGRRAEEIAGGGAL